MHVVLRRLIFAAPMIASFCALASDVPRPGNPPLQVLLVSTLQNLPSDISDMSKAVPGGMVLDPNRAGHAAYTSGRFVTKDGFTILSVEALAGPGSGKVIYAIVKLMLKPCADQATVSRILPGTWITDKRRDDSPSYKTKNFTMSVTLKQGSSRCIYSFSRSIVPYALPPPYKHHYQNNLLSPTGRIHTSR